MSQIDQHDARPKLARSWSTSSLCSMSALTIICLALFAALAFIAPPVEAKSKQVDGKLESKLDEYHSTIKCMLNIAEETLPELNDFITCCGFWALHDFIIHRVDDECDAHNLQQVKHLAGLMVPHVRDQCIGYEHGSFTCRLLVIMPITFAILFIAFLVGICVCACVSFHKWMAVRRKYRKVVNYDVANNTVIPLNNKNNLTIHKSKLESDP